MNLHLDIILPAFVAGLIVLITHVPLGIEVIKRGIIFIDLAIAQLAGLGALIVTQMELAESVWLVQFAAIFFALLGAWLFHWVERKHPGVEEALIGVTFVLAATAGILVLAGDPHAGQQLKDLLVGQILWVDWKALIVPAIISITITLIWLLGDYQSSWVFYVLFAIAITTSVQLVGVYLVFASLIIPALCVIKYAKYKNMMVGMAIGMSGYLLGLIGSSIFDLPSGPMIVWSLAVVGLLFYAKDTLLFK